jgi:hypothetical protein
LAPESRPRLNLFAKMADRRLGSSRGIFDEKYLGQLSMAKKNALECLKEEGNQNYHMKTANVNESNDQKR